MLIPKSTLQTYTDEEYQETERSQLLPDLNLDLLHRCIRIENHARSLREFRAEIGMR
ncbi:hypothetical protein VB714_00555 [Spirulina sp. 06S082]|nr:hypothetical protein [Spirulina sp. 06S082]MEA5467340.1 hypothetical protein [Spirulina sp. 06S082]